MKKEIVVAPNFRVIVSPGIPTPTKLRDLNVETPPIDQWFLKYEQAKDRYVHEVLIIKSCTDVIDCIEATWTLDLSSVLVTLWQICWDITFCIWATIDRTNTTNTWTQNFDENYIANYNWSEINIGSTLISCDSTLDISDGATHDVTFPVGTKYVHVNVTHLGIYYPNAILIGNPGGDTWLIPGTTTTLHAITLNLTQNRFMLDQPELDVQIDVCYYENNAVVNISNAIINSLWDTINSTRDNYNYTGVIINYDSTSIITYNGVPMTPLDVMTGWVDVHTTSIIDFTGAWINSVTWDPVLMKIVVDINWGSWGSVDVYSEWTLVEAAVPALNFTGTWVTTVWNPVTMQVDIDIPSWGLVCQDVIDCVEAAATLDLSWVSVTFWEICWSITFCVWGATIDWTYTTNTGTQEFDDTYIANYDNSTINYTSTFTLIGCTHTNPVPYTEAIDPTATKIEVTISYDNWIWDQRQKTVDITALTWPLTVVAPTGMTGSFWVSRGANMGVVQLSWLWTATVDICQFSGGMIINYDGVINNYTNGTINNYNGVYNYYDQYSTTVNMWDNYYENLITNNLIVNNITMPPGSTIVVNWSWAEETFTDAIPWWVTCQLTGVPIDVYAIFVFKKDSWLVWFQTLDYTYDPGTQIVTLITPLTVGESVLIKYMLASNPIINSIKKVTWVVWTGPDDQLVVTDVDCTTGSVIMWRTISAGTQVWFRQFTVWAGSFTIDSTAAESWLTFNYVIYV